MTDLKNKKDKHHLKYDGQIAAGGKLLQRSGSVHGRLTNNPLALRYHPPLLQRAPTSTVAKKPELSLTYEHTTNPQVDHFTNGFITQWYCNNVQHNPMARSGLEF